MKEIPKSWRTVCVGDGCGVLMDCASAVNNIKQHTLPTSNFLNIKLVLTKVEKFDEVILGKEHGWRRWSIS